MSVSDTGVGITRELQQRIFEPFFTTKELGTGLGLATVHGVVKQSGGHIDLRSEPGQGTTFHIYLPRVTAPSVPSKTPPARTSQPSGTETILLVEDETSVRHLTQRVLETRGYTVLEASRADKAIQVSDLHSGPIHLMITDVVMPGGTSGPELAKLFADLRPQMRILYVSGYTDDEVLRHGVLEESMAFLQKPFSPSTLTHKVRDVLDAPRQGKSG
jgi:CheY-like chemotaxis protein